MYEELTPERDFRGFIAVAANRNPDLPGIPTAVVSVKIAFFRIIYRICAGKRREEK